MNLTNRRSIYLVVLASLPFLPGLECSSSRMAQGEEPPVDPGPAGLVENPKVALDGSGNGIIVYERSSPGVGSRVSAQTVSGSGLGSEAILAAGGGSTVSNRFPQVALAADGMATAVWVEQDLVLAGGLDRLLVRRLDSGTWGPPEVVSDDTRTPLSDERFDIASPALAVAADGSATAAWIERFRNDVGAADQLVASSVVVSSLPGTAPALSIVDIDAAFGSITDVSVAMLNDNLRVVAYRLDSVADGPTVYASIDQGAGFETPMQLDAGIAGGGPPTSAVLDPDGVPVVAWSGDDGLYWSAFIGGWMPGETVPPDNSAGQASPTLAADGFGNGVLAWTNSIGVFSTAVQFDANRPLWLPMVQLNSQPTSNALIALSASADGNARAVWTEAAGRPVYAAEYLDGQWQAQEQIAQSAADGQPDVARDASLTAVAVWPNTELAQFVWTATPPSGTAFTLTTSIAGNGAGTVSYNPTGSDCGEDCREYASGTGVTLTAMPDANSTFAGFSGDTDCADGMVAMTADLSCTVTFDEADVGAVFSVSLQISNQGGSSADRVTSSPAGILCEAGPDPMNNQGTCVAQFNANQVALTAEPDTASGDTFESWGGCDELQPQPAGAPDVCVVNNPGDGSTVNVGVSFAPAGG